MKINVTVKTLDSQNHSFADLEDDITVRQFKDKIAERINVAADRQRLIYCGRVLNDEKSLKDYDVSGKVVHLVQREPPSSRPAPSSGSNNPMGNTTRRARSTGGDGTASLLRHLESMDGNMVLGGMMIPMTTGETTTQAAIPSLNPSSTLCMNRITVARHMLDCANNIVAYLENPERGLNNAEMDILSHQTMESTVFEVGISAVGISAVPQQEVRNFVQAFQGVVSDAFRQNGISNISVQQQNEPQTGMPTVQVYGNVPNNQMLAELISGAVRAAENSAVAGAAAATAAAATAASASASSNPTATATSSTDSPSTATPTSGNNSAHSTPSRQRQQTTSPTVLAEVVQQMRTVQTRMEPFVQQYYDILMNDPSFETGDTAARESAQRVYDRVSEALHYMSHAQHAISDLMLDLAINSPRHLCCRPMLVEQSAYLSSGIASVPNNIIRLNGSNNNNNTETGNHNIGIILAQSQSSDDSSSPRDGSPENSPNIGGAATAQQQANSQHMQVARLIQAVVNSAPMNADVHVQINAGTSSPGPASSNNAAASNLSGPQLNTATTNTSSVGETCNTGNGGDGPRVTSITLPTTSTQTRSTARPQMHLTGGGIPSTMRNLRPIPANMLSSFDRFLPCNSHHIRELPSNQVRVQTQTQSQQAQQQQQNRSRPSTRSGLSLIERLQASAAAAAAATATSTTQTEPSSSSTQVNVSTDDTPITFFGTQLTLRDFMNISSNTAPLNAIRQNLSQYMNETLGASGGNQPDFDMIINIPIINQLLSLLTQYDLPGFNTRATVENLIRESATTLMDLLTSVNTATANVDFGATIVSLCTGFIRKLFTVLIICQGRENAERCLEMISQLTVVSAENVSALQILLRYFMNVVRLLLDDINSQSSTSNTTQLAACLVTRPAAQPESAGGEKPSCGEPSPMDTDEPIEEPKPMAVDSTPASPVTPPKDKPSTSSSSPAVASAEQEVVTKPAASNATLPNVVIGSEPWHTHLPNDWIPIISRDVVRQRTLSPQRPYSDAYISGMSSKRRKLITSTKLPTDVPSLLADGVREAVRTSGVSSANVNVDELAVSIASDPVVQCSYREALKENIKERLKKDPDFDPEKYPNSSKFVEK